MLKEVKLLKKVCDHAKVLVHCQCAQYTQYTLVHSTCQTAQTSSHYTLPFCSLVGLLMGTSESGSKLKVTWNTNTVKHILRDHCHEGTTCLEGPPFFRQKVLHQKPPILRDYILRINGTVLLRSLVLAGISNMSNGVLCLLLETTHTHKLK